MAYFGLFEVVSEFGVLEIFIVEDDVDLIVEVMERLKVRHSNIF